MYGRQISRRERDTLQYKTERPVGGCYSIVDIPFYMVFDESCSLGVDQYETNFML